MTGLEGDYVNDHKWNRFAKTFLSEDLYPDDRLTSKELADLGIKKETAT